MAVRRRPSSTVAVSRGAVVTTCVGPAAAMPPSRHVAARPVHYVQNRVCVRPKNTSKAHDLEKIGYGPWGALT